MLTLKEAAKRLTKSEYALYLSSEARHLEKMTRYQIDLKLKRLQKEINKLKDEKLKIKRVFKSAGMEAEKLIKSKTKLKFLNEAFKRLKAKIKAIGTPSKKVAVKKKSPLKKSPIKKVTAKKTRVEVKTPKTKKKSMRNTGVIRKQAHSSSRDKRSQARKDSR
jgi:hypothetical protein